MALSDFFKNKKTTKLGNALKPMGDFPLIDARDVIVDYDDETKKEIRLDERLLEIYNKCEKPLFSIFDGNELYVSYDNGVTWEIVGTLPGGGGSIELDTTLTQEGKAADAKAVRTLVNNVVGEIQIRLKKI